jgi:hypothetical protein
MRCIDLFSIADTARGMFTVTLLATSACASIIDGSTQVVSFNSNPDAARVIVNGAEIGTTPLSTQVKRKNVSAARRPSVIANAPRA